MLCNSEDFITTHSTLHASRHTHSLPAGLILFPGDSNESGSTWPLMWCRIFANGLWSWCPNGIIHPQTARKQDLEPMPMGSCWHGVKKTGLLLKAPEQWSAWALCVCGAGYLRSRNRPNKDALVSSGWLGTQGLLNVRKKELFSESAKHWVRMGFKEMYFGHFWPDLIWSHTTVENVYHQVSGALLEYTLCVYPQHVDRFSQLLLHLRELRVLSTQAEDYLSSKHLSGDVPCNKLLIEMLHAKRACIWHIDTKVYTFTNTNIYFIVHNIENMHVWGSKHLGSSLLILPILFAHNNRLCRCSRHSQRKDYFMWTWAT